MSIHFTETDITIQTVSNGFIVNDGKSDKDAFVFNDTKTLTDWLDAKLSKKTEDNENSL